MSILIKTDSESPVLSKQSEQLFTLLQKLSIKIMRQAETVLTKQMVAALQARYKQLISNEDKIVEFIQYFISCTLNHIDQIQHDLPTNITREDYQALESSIQRAEAEIRKHIKIEQQLKIYMDNLEEKISEQQHKLAVEGQKYAQLYESMKQIDLQRKQLSKKIAKFSHDRQKVQSQQNNYDTINDQLYKIYYGKNTKANPKTKHVMDKYNDRIRRLSQNKNDSKIEMTDSEIPINLPNNITVSKKNSYDQNLTRVDQMHQDASIMQLMKTVQMKKLVHTHQRRKNRKVSKYKTEFNELAEKKEGRSNSVFN